MANAKIVKHNGYPAISVDGRIYPPMTATVVSSRMEIGKEGREIDVQYYKELGDAGIKLYYIMCNNLDMEKHAVKDFEDEVNKILSVVPDAYIIVRIPLTPSEQWVIENPDHIVTYSDGSFIPAVVRTESFSTDCIGMPSLCSWKWRKDYGDNLLQVIDKIEKLAISERIIGYFVGGGCNSEWFYRTASVSGLVQAQKYYVHS